MEENLQYQQDGENDQQENSGSSRSKTPSTTRSARGNRIARLRDALQYNYEQTQLRETNSEQDIEKTEKTEDIQRPSSASSSLSNKTPRSNSRIQRYGLPEIVGSPESSLFHTAYSQVATPPPFLGQFLPPINSKKQDESVSQNDQGNELGDTFQESARQPEAMSIKHEESTMGSTFRNDTGSQSKKFEYFEIDFNNITSNQKESPKNFSQDDINQVKEKRKKISKIPRRNGQFTSSRSNRQMIDQERGGKSSKIPRRISQATTQPSPLVGSKSTCAQNMRSTNTDTLMKNSRERNDKGTRSKNFEFFEVDTKSFLKTSSRNVSKEDAKATERRHISIKVSNTELPTLGSRSEAPPCVGSHITNNQDTAYPPTKPCQVESIEAPSIESDSKIDAVLDSIRDQGVSSPAYQADLNLGTVEATGFQHSHSQEQARDDTVCTGPKDTHNQSSPQGGSSSETDRLLDAVRDQGTPSADFDSRGPETPALSYSCPQSRKISEENTDLLHHRSKSQIKAQQKTASPSEQDAPQTEGHQSIKLSSRRSKSRNMEEQKIILGHNSPEYLTREEGNREISRNHQVEFEESNQSRALPCHPVESGPGERKCRRTASRSDQRESPIKSNQRTESENRNVDSYIAKGVRTFFSHNRFESEQKDEERTNSPYCYTESRPRGTSSMERASRSPQIEFRLSGNQRTASLEHPHSTDIKTTESANHQQSRTRSQQSTTHQFHRVESRRDDQVTVLLPSMMAKYAKDHPELPVPCAGSIIRVTDGTLVDPFDTQPLPKIQPKNRQQESAENENKARPCKSQIEKNKDEAIKRNLPSTSSQNPQLAPTKIPKPQLCPKPPSCPNPPLCPKPPSHPKPPIVRDTKASRLRKLKPIEAPIEKPVFRRRARGNSPPRAIRVSRSPVRRPVNEVELISFTSSSPPYTPLPPGPPRPEWVPQLNLDGVVSPDGPPACGFKETKASRLRRINQQQRAQQQQEEEEQKAREENMMQPRNRIQPEEQRKVNAQALDNAQNEMKATTKKHVEPKAEIGNGKFRETKASRLRRLALREDEESKAELEKLKEAREPAKRSPTPTFQPAPPKPYKKPAPVMVRQTRASKLRAHLPVEEKRMPHQPHKRNIHTLPQVDPKKMVSDWVTTASSHASMSTSLSPSLFSPKNPRSPKETIDKSVIMEKEGVKENRQCPGGNEENEMSNIRPTAVRARPRTAKRPIFPIEEPSQKEPATRHSEFSQPCRSDKLCAELPTYSSESPQPSTSHAGTKNNEKTTGSSTAYIKSSDLSQPSTSYAVPVYHTEDCLPSSSNATEVPKQYIVHAKVSACSLESPEPSTSYANKPNISEQCRRESEPSTSYVQCSTKDRRESEPSSSYVQCSTKDRRESEPSTSYVQCSTKDRRESEPSTSYVQCSTKDRRESEPSTSYVQCSTKDRRESEPSTSYVQCSTKDRRESEPSTSYVQCSTKDRRESEPSTSYAQCSTKDRRESEPSTSYVQCSTKDRRESEPSTSYVQCSTKDRRETQSSTTYVQCSTKDRRESEPSTSYVQCSTKDSRESKPSTSNVEKPSKPKKVVRFSETSTSYIVTPTYTEDQKPDVSYGGIPSKLRPTRCSPPPMPASQDATPRGKPQDPSVGGGEISNAFAGRRGELDHLYSTDELNTQRAINEAWDRLDVKQENLYLWMAKFRNKKVSAESLKYHIEEYDRSRQQLQKQLAAWRKKGS